MDPYLTQSVYSDPGALDLGALPREPAQLARLVRNVMIHRGEGELFGHAVDGRWLREDAESRRVTTVLRLLRERSDLPLTERREPAERFVGTCRDFSLLLCSLLRATGTPARPRCGFADYFVADWYEDHWVTEFRLPGVGWQLMDAQIAYGPYDVSFDPLDVPRDRFLVAGRAWRECRAGRADPRSFGLSWDEGLRGLWFVRGNVLRDLAALNGVEVLPWDCWGPEIVDDTGLTDGELASVDRVAAARTDEEARRLYRDPRLAVPDEVVSYTSYSGVRKVRLPGP
ncbi:transglutaminase-like domain-containing protein [Streptomyces sp. NPDC054842]